MDAKHIITNESGFTLIELIVIIVILGILAVTAIPKYQDMQTDARVAAADGVYGACQGATSINFAAELLPGTAASVDPILSTDATTLTDALDGGLPEGWVYNAGPTGICLGTTAGTCVSYPYTTGGPGPYTILVTLSQDTTTKAVLSKSWN